MSRTSRALRFIGASVLLSAVTFAATTCGSDKLLRPTPASIARLLGEAQSGAVGSALANPVTVKVTDGGGSGISGVAVQWTVLRGGGSVNPASSTTDGTGTAATTWTLGTIAGLDSLSASLPASAGIAPVMFSATALPGPAAQLALTTAAAGAPSGAAFTTQPAVTIRDAHGNTVTADNSTVVSMTVSSGATVVGTATATAVAGVATFSGVGISGTAGTAYTLTFASGTLTAATESITPSAGASTQLALATAPVGAASGAAFTTQPVVAIKDAVGNTVTTNNIAVVTMTVSSGATVVGTATATASSGLATFTNVGISGAAGTAYTLTFSSGTLTAITSSITLGSGGATALVLTTSAAGAASGAAFATQPVVTLKDGAGNTAATDNSTVVTMTVSTGATVVGTATATAANGVAAFANVGISGTAGTAYTLTFGSGSLTAATQQITPTAGAATHLVLATPAAGAASGTAFATQPVVLVKDGAGNTVATDNSSVVTMTVSTGGSVVGTGTATAASGVATFTNVGIAGTAGTAYTLTFLSLPLTEVTQSITPTTGTATQLVLTRNAAGASSGAAFTTQPVVEVRDGAGNTVRTDNITVVTMTVSAGASVVGTATATASSGLATFTNVGITGTSGTAYTLTFAGGSLTPATQSITPGVGAATQLVLTTNAAGALSGAAFATQPVVAVRDVAGNTVTSDNSSVVTMTVSSGATVVGTATATAANGVATFTNAGIAGTSGTQYTLTFASGSLTSATQSITPGTGAASQLVLTTSAAGAGSGLAFTTQPAVAVKDGAGNTVTTDNSTVVTMAVSAGGSVVGTATATAASGVATFTGVGISGTAGGYTLTFSSGVLTAATQPITLTAGVASQLVLTTSAAGAQSASAFTTQPVVAVKDAAGNTVLTDNSTIVTMTVNDGAGVVGAATATAASGVATFTTVGISGTAGSYTLTFGSGVLTNATQPIALTAGTATHLLLTTDAGGSMSGAAFTTQPVVAVKDGAGNTVTTDNSSVVTMTVSAGATVVGTATATASSGVATFQTVGISGTAGTQYTLSFGSGALTPATQPITPTTGSAGRLALMTSAAGAASGLAFTTQPAVAVQDGAGNTVTTDNSTVVTMTVSTGGTVVGTATATASSGIATFANVGISGLVGPYTLTFGSGALVQATQPITLTPGTATQFVLTMQAAGARSGLAFATQPVVALEDAAGNTVTSNNSTVVTMTVNNSGTVVGTATATLSSGVATFSNVGITGTAGQAYVLSFGSGPTLNAATESITPTAGLPAQLTLTTQAAGAASGSAFTTPPAVAIRDAQGNQVLIDNSTTVTMSVNGGATVYGSGTATAVGGLATFTGQGISGTVGNYTLTFTSGTLTQITQPIALGVGVATQAQITTLAAGATSGAAFTTQPVVVLKDGAGNLVTNDNSTVVTMTVSGSATVFGTGTGTASNGIVNFSGQGITGIAGPYTLTFDGGSLTAATQPINLAAGAATKLAVATAAGGAGSGAAFLTQPVVDVQDAQGNTVLTDNSTVVTMAVSTGGTPVGTISATASGGVATFVNAGINGLVGPYTLTFSSSPVLTEATQPITLGPGVPAHLLLTRDAVGARSGLAFTTQPKVTVLDAQGNVVTTDISTVVTMSVTGGTVVNTSTATAVNGVATFTDVGISGTVAGSPYTLTYSSGSLTTSTQQITLTAGLPNQLYVMTTPANAQSGLPFGTQPAIAVQDADGNQVLIDNSSQVTMTVSAGGTVVGTASETASGGLATFTNVGISGLVGNYTLTFASGALLPATLGINLTAGLANKLAVTTAAAGARSGLAFSAPPAVTIQDAQGNTVILDNATQVTMSVSTGGTVVGTATATAASGVADFTGTNVGISGLVGNYTLTFTSSPVLTPATQTNLPLAAGNPAQLVLTTPAAGAAANVAFTTQPVVTVVDAQGNPLGSLDPGTAVDISVSLGASVIGTHPVTAVNGVVTFSDVGINGLTGNVYTLLYTSGTLGTASQSILLP